MSIGNLKTPAEKGSNYNWQLRMLQIASKCCPTLMTESQRVALTDVPLARMVYQVDGAEGLYIYKSTGWTLIA